MQRNYLLIVFLFSTLILKSQNVQLSATSINQGGFDYVTIAGIMDDGYVALQSNIPLGTDKDRVGLKTRKLQVSYFDAKLSKKWQMPIVSGIAGGNIEGVIVFQNNLLIIYSVTNKENGVFELYYDSYNSLGNSLMLKSKLTTSTIAKFSNLERTRIVISPDKKSFGIYLNESDENKQSIHFVTCSENGTITKKDFEIKYGSSLLYLNNFLLDNTGNLFMSGQLKNKENKKQKSQELFCYVASINEVIEKPLTEFGSSISDILLKYNPLKNEIICGGIGVDNTSSSGSGIKLMIIDSVFNFKEVNYSIQGGNLKDLIGERNSSGISLDNYTIQDLILREDGGALLVAEAQYLSEYSYYDQFTQTFNRRTEYHFDNVVVFSVSPSGAIDWCRVIKKDQVSMDDFGIFSSFASYFNDQEIGFLYNKDSGKNFELMHVVISKDGLLSSKRVNKSNIDAIVPKYNKQVEASSTCVPVLIKRQLYLAKFEFE
ncbi:MAG: hypothetical protein ACKOX3_11950 [Bacteroidota bacterium]